MRFALVTVTFEHVKGGTAMTFTEQVVGVVGEAGGNEKAPRVVTGELTDYLTR